MGVPYRSTRCSRAAPTPRTPRRPDPERDLDAHRPATHLRHVQIRGLGRGRLGPPGSRRAARPVRRGSRGRHRRPGPRHRPAGPAPRRLPGSRVGGRRRGAPGGADRSRTGGAPPHPTRPSTREQRGPDRRCPAALVDPGAGRQCRGARPAGQPRRSPRHPEGPPRRRRHRAVHRPRTGRARGHRRRTAPRGRRGAPRRRGPGRSCWPASTRCPPATRCRCRPRRSGPTRHLRCCGRSTCSSWSTTPTRRSRLPWLRWRAVSRSSPPTRACSPTSWLTASPGCWSGRGGTAPAIRALLADPLGREGMGLAAIDRVRARFGQDVVAGALAHQLAAMVPDVAPDEHAAAS